MEFQFKNRLINIYDIKSFFNKRINFLIYKPFLGKLGQNVSILRPLKIKGLRNIFIENKVVIKDYCWLESIPLTGLTAKLSIEEGASIGHFCQIYATHEVVIGKYVDMADKCYISDNLHEYEDISKPTMDLPIKQLNPVRIGDGSWIGTQVSIIGASIGKHCVIGANSVVTKDIPDYCVAVGTPAIIVKRYDIMSQTWKKTDKYGKFLDIE